MVKRVTVLGATGSIGRQTLEIVQKFPEQFKVVALTAYQNIEKLAAVARTVNAEYAVIADEAQYAQLKTLLAGTAVKAAAGAAAINDAAAMPADLIMCAIIGIAGLAPTLRAIESGATITLANKEAMVCAGDLINQKIRQHGNQLLPVDSEHNAIFQIHQVKHDKFLRRVILTASGGPFRNYTLEQMRDVTPAQALKHPNWDMGAKITIDSATMMNKALEMIEAHYLFNLPSSQIDVVVHPEQIIHSLVEYHDGSTLAQLGYPDMKTPISYCLGWPDRLDMQTKPLNLAEIGKFSFAVPDTTRFPALDLARQAMAQSATAPIWLNAANEVAVAAFLAGKIGFLNIAEIVDRTLQAIENVGGVASLDEIMVADRAARHIAAQGLG